MSALWIAAGAIVLLGLGAITGWCIGYWRGHREGWHQAWEASGEPAPLSQFID